MVEIHKRTYEEARMKKMTDGVKTSAEMMETLNLAKIDIWEQVACFLDDNYGEEKLPEKMTHFEESWEKFYEEYGNDLIIALGEQTDEVNFVNHEGYLDKNTVRELVKDIHKRRERLNSLLASRGAF